MPNMGQIGQIFNSPLVLGVFLTIIVVIVATFMWLIIRNVRGGFGKLGRPKQLIQRCICITSSNLLCIYQLKIDDDFVTDPKNQAEYHLYSDALIPKHGTGELYLPLDTRSAVPLYLLEPERRAARVRQAATDLDFIADIEDEKASEIARQKAEKGNTIEMQKFALLAVMVILGLISIAIMIMKIL